MKTKIFTLLLALAASVETMFASITIGGISYNLHKSTLTAEVTYNGSSYSRNTYSGAITIPSTVHYSENGTLYTYNVTSIGDNAFRSSIGLTSITIPNSVTTIGNNAFSDCSKLTSINVNTNNAYYISNNGVLFNKGMTSLKQYPAGKKGNYTIPSSVSIIEEGAFNGCRNLTSITIPNSITSIGDGAFRICSGLTSLTIPNSVTSIGGSAFLGCSGLTSITIGNSVTSIGESAFESCSGLTSLTIPNSVSTIGLFAFRYCSGLVSVKIGNGISIIEISAFSDCTNLASVTIGSNVTYIGLNAFNKCNNLTSVTINSNSLVSKSYTSTSNISTIFGDNVTEYNIGDGITNIGSNAFFGCSAMNSITIPNSVTTIGNNAFSGCSNINEIHYHGNILEWCEKSWNTYIISSNYKLYIENELISNLIIPNGVTSIGEWAFSNCMSLTSVTIPNSVTKIKDGAFAYCSSLTSVTIPNSVKNIGRSTFFGCSVLTSIAIPNSVTSIGDGAFGSCSGLTSIDVAADNINYCSVEGVLFNKDQTSLIKYPGGKQGAYIIPNSVTSIRSDAFSGCSVLTSIDIPNSVTSIEYGAFYGCSVLTSVTIEADTPPTLGSSIENIFDSRYLTSIYVPCGTSETYRTAAGWSSYASKIKEQSLPYAITTKALNGTISIDSICLDITLTAIPNEGYYFTQWSDGNKDNPRTFVLTQDTTFTAEFSNQYSINITCNEEYGTIVGENGMFDYLSEHTYEAVPNSGYHFTQWSDGNKDNPRTITLTQDTSLTAEFSKQYSIHVSCNEEQGSINGENGMFDYLSEHTYEAVPNSGYYFDQWSDGNKDNPRTIVLTQDTSLIAIFDILYNVSVLSDDPTMGSASFSDLLETQSLNYGQYPIGTNLIAKAIPNQGYKFSHWSDGLSANRRGITVQSDINLKAYFELEQNSYTVTVSSANSSMGTVSGGGTYEEGQTATVTATPKSGYKFTRWSNGSTANPYSFTVTSNVSLTAYFEQSTTPQSESKFWNISDAVFNSLGTITSQTTINGLTIHATANKPIVVDADAREINGYSFTHRLKFGGTGASNARMLSFRVDGDCDIDIYLMSASGSADRTLNVDKGSFGSTLQQIPAYGSTISRGNVHYAGGATTIYLYSPSSGVNIYAIQVSYGSTPPQPNQYTIRFLNYNGTVLQSSQVAHGSMPSYTGATPTKPEDDDYTYAFNGWSPAVVAATADADYTAQFTATPKTPVVGGDCDPFVCDFTAKASSHSAYNDSWVYDTDWTVYGGANNSAQWDYVKMGGKNTHLANANPGYVVNKSAFDCEIASVKVTFHAGSFSKSGMSCNNWGVKVYSDLACANLLYSVNGGTIAKTAQELTINAESGKPWSAGYAIQVYWDLANTSTTNGIVLVSKIEYIPTQSTSPTDIQNVSDSANNVARKVLINGQLFILRDDGTIFDARGVRVK